MKKLVIELNQTFKIELKKEDFQEMKELGIDTENIDEVYDYLEDEIKETIEYELDFYRNSYITIEGN